MVPAHSSSGRPLNHGLHRMLIAVTVIALTLVFGDAPLKAAVPTGDMVRVPAGPFIMGSDARWPDEGPNHEVYLPAYDIDAHEVTNEQYYKFMQATGRPRRAISPMGNRRPAARNTRSYS
jgi:formylglycine-generating enzyme required for sulfatase activity